MGARVSMTGRLLTARRPSGSAQRKPFLIATEAMAYWNKGDYEQAIADLTEAIRIDRQ